MKKWIAALALLATINANAQNFRLGLGVSPSVSWMNPISKSLKADGSVLNFSYGLLGDFAIKKSDNYFISTGLTIGENGGKMMFAQKAFDYGTGIDTFNNVSYSYRNKYVEIPLMIKLKTNEIGYMKYFLGIGMHVGFLASATAKIDLDPGHDLFVPNQKLYVNLRENNNLDGIMKDNIGFFRGSLHVTGGAEYNLAGKTWAFAGLYWDKGFTNIMASGSNLSVNNQSVGLQFGVFF